MTLSRRNLAAILPALLAGANRAAAAEVLPSMAINGEDLPVRQSSASRQRRFLDGLTHDNIPIEIHETQLPPHGAPHPPHKHVHEELVVVHQGSIEVSLEGQEPKIVSAGGLVYAASNQMHGWKNAGDTPASYLVIAVGRKG
jgi:uncharacterized cupin superfamily protein